MGGPNTPSFAARRGLQWSSSRTGGSNGSCPVLPTSDEAVDVPVEHRLGVAGLDSGAEILDAGLVEPARCRRSGSASSSGACDGGVRPRCGILPLATRLRTLSVRRTSVSLQDKQPSAFSPMAPMTHLRRSDSKLLLSRPRTPSAPVREPMPSRRFFVRNSEWYPHLSRCRESAADAPSPRPGVPVGVGDRLRALAARRSCSPIGVGDRLRGDDGRRSPRGHSLVLGLVIGRRGHSMAASGSYPRFFDLSRPDRALVRVLVVPAKARNLDPRAMGRRLPRQSPSPGPASAPRTIRPPVGVPGKAP